MSTNTIQQGKMMSYLILDNLLTAYNADARTVGAQKRIRSRQSTTIAAISLRALRLHGRRVNRRTLFVLR
jgi:hypothetical protein